ncbi:hypothetical protein AMTRI_Chr01g137500 [Amborella trichopoda]
MAIKATFVVFTTLLFFSLNRAQLSPETSTPPRALVAPLSLDPSTSQVTIPLDNNSYVLDLGGAIPWSFCHGLSSGLLLSCRGRACLAAEQLPEACASPIGRPPLHQCYQGNCVVWLHNPVANTCASSKLALKTVTLTPTNGLNPTGSVAFPHFISSWVPRRLLGGLAKGAKGLATLGPSELAIPSQLHARLGLRRKFALCLPSTPRAPGAAFFGSEPFYLLPPPGIEVSKRLLYVPLLTKPDGYYIQVQAITISLNGVNFNSSLLSRGTKLSTVHPYTTLATPIYKAFVETFNEATGGIPRVRAVEPFDVCLNTSKLGSTRVGLPVGPINLVLANGLNWVMVGANTMKQVSNDVACLAFVDGGMDAKNAILLGSYQMQDNFLLFDVGASKLGFTSSLLFQQTTCSNFNFTSASL